MVTGEGEGVPFEAPSVALLTKHHSSITFSRSLLGSSQCLVYDATASHIGIESRWYLEAGAEERTVKPNSSEQRLQARDCSR